MNFKPNQAQNSSSEEITFLDAIPTGVYDFLILSTKYDDFGEYGSIKLFCELKDHPGFGITFKFSLSPKAISVGMNFGLFHFFSNLLDHLNLTNTLAEIQKLPEGAWEDLASLLTKDLRGKVFKAPVVSYLNKYNEKDYTRCEFPPFFTLDQTENEMHMEAEKMCNEREAPMDLVTVDVFTKPESFDSDLEPVSSDSEDLPF